ncbi:hypothetical protein O181_061066 [Austropuccinia psidii MF-1]|uniref:Reverse transcriptase/retrotransposon-derived protein RNase H-like domain-containing protein n=1 Tax=Austropuccinia psidii MF-1 TaxID=1389203 RepID=A0A9Q3HX59_9BASI|nr:hypothetical protein [Austropuccinia psidii MF-1]
MCIQHSPPASKTRSKAKTQSVLNPTPRAPFDGTPAVSQLRAHLDKGPNVEGSALSRKEGRVPTSSSFSGVVRGFPGLSRTTLKGPGEDENDSDYGHLSTVLARLRANNLFANASKCLFHVSSVEYLGYGVSSKGLKIYQEKVQQILHWPPPRNLREIQSFLGFASFYHCLIKNYSKKICSLTSFLKKDSHFPLNEEALIQFNQLKEAFTIAPILPYFYPSLPKIVETDASNYALGAVLSQISDSGKYPIAFDSLKPLLAELNNETHNKELLGIVWALKCWRSFLSLYSSFEVLTNHSSLQYFIS